MYPKKLDPLILDLAYINIQFQFVANKVDNIKCEYIELFENHITDVWCNIDTSLATYVLVWFADIIQHPYEKPGAGIGIYGTSG